MWRARCRRSIKCRACSRPKPIAPPRSCRRADEQTGEPMSRLDRREFLTGSMALIGAGAVGAAGGALAEAATTPAAKQQSAAQLAERSLANELGTRMPFDGPHQAGILNRAPAQATFVALDSIAPDRSTLVAALKDLSARARELTQGSTVGAEELDDPPPDCGVL